MNHRWARRWRQGFLRLFTASMVTALAVAAAAPFESQTFDTPRADAGAGRTVVIGESVALDASGSTDDQGDRLKYMWTLRAPPGSGAQLSDPTAVRPRFAVDLLGDYVAELVVSDGDTQSEAATVRFSTGNVAPIADAGTDRTIRIGETVLLDASASSDFNGDTLNYRWAVIEAPAGSRAAPASAKASMTSFTPDRDGEYVLALVASDGRLDSAPALLRLNTLDSQPRADAGIDRNIFAGTAVRLDGRESADADDDTIDYAWSLLHAPKHSRGRAVSASSSAALLCFGA